MKKPTTKELLEVMARELLNLNKQINDMNEKINFLNNLFEVKQDIDLHITDDETICFTEEFYKEICKHCGTKGIDFMGIA